MDLDLARTRLTTERAEVTRLIEETRLATTEDVDAEAETGDAIDPAQPLTAEAVDQAVVQSLQDKLTAIDRALTRIDDGTYGVSVRSGEPIPDERLDADPTAELTVAEAAADEAAAR